MTALTQISTGGSVRPGASWPGWAGYAPTARGPEARRARAQAAGILEPAPAAITVAGAGPAAELEPSAEPPVRCGGRARRADGGRSAARVRSRATAGASA